MLSKEQIIALMKRAMSTLEWKYKFQEDDGVFIVHWSPSYFFADIQMLITLYDTHLTVIVRSDTMVKKNISRVAEYLIRINYDLFYGALEMNCDNGSIRYFLRLPYGEIFAHGEDNEKGDVMFITYLIVKSLFVYDVCATGFYSIMLGATTPKKAAKKAKALMDKYEKNDNDDDDDEDDNDDDNDDDDDDDDDGFDIDDDVFDDDETDDDETDDDETDDDTEPDDDDDTENDDTENDDTDGDDENKPQDDDTWMKRKQARELKALRGHLCDTFDIMNEKRSTMFIDKTLEEQELIVGNETVPDQRPQKAAYVLRRKKTG